MSFDLSGITFLQSASTAHNLSIGGLFNAFANSSSNKDVLGVSSVTQSRITRFQDQQDALNTRLDSLESVKDLITALSSAAAGLRSMPESIGDDISVTKTDKNANTVSLNSTASADLQTGDMIAFSSSFAGITASNRYFVSVGPTSGNETDFTLYTTRDDALNGTNAFDISSSGTFSDVIANQVLPEPEEGIDSLFEAYNNLQDFLSDNMGSDSPLAPGLLVRSLQSDLSRLVSSAVNSSKLSSVLNRSGSNRKVTVNETALSSQLDQHRQEIAALFSDAGGIAEQFQTVALNAYNAVGNLILTSKGKSASITRQLADLTKKAATEQESAQWSLAMAGKSILLSDVNLKFLGGLFSLGSQSKDQDKNLQGN